MDIARMARHVGTQGFSPLPGNTLDIALMILTASLTSSRAENSFAGDEREHHQVRGEHAQAVE